MSNFTDQKPRKATMQHLQAPWRGKVDGSAFRCYLCGRRFKVGDVWRFLWAAHEGAPNCLVCEACDGPDVLERWKAQFQEAQERFWWWKS